MFFGAIYASSAGPSLNRENTTRDLSWTKPVPRTVLALQFILIDVAAIAIVFALAVLAIVAVLLRLQMVPVLDAAFRSGTGRWRWASCVDVVRADPSPDVRASRPARGAIGGILWPVAFVALGLGEGAGRAGR